ncbi:MAG: hypothetical protein DSY37_02565 [Hyperthermus sp.]|nr:MAG: hypothetical protein DSY37_02565 [Hyperthermus sp.]
MDAAIIGGGPAGLAVASHVKHTDLVVLEARRKLGHPPHCTGVVSPSTATRLDAWEVVEAQYTVAVFLDGGFKEACRLEDKPVAVKLSRPGLEELLAARVEDAGHRVYRGVRVRGVIDGKGGIRVVADGWRGFFGRVVVATGINTYNPTIPLPVSQGSCNSIVGVEARVVFEERVGDEEFYTIHATSLAPSFFAWIAPLSGGREAAVGLAGGVPGSLYDRLRLLLALVSRRLSWIRGVKDYRGGVIARGPPALKASRGPILWIGDVLCASKPFTGGGLYAISVLAPHAAKALDAGDVNGLEEVWKSLRRELILQRSATRAALAARHLFPRLLSLACSPARRGLCKVRFDEHSSLLPCLLLGLASRGD